MIRNELREVDCSLGESNCAENVHFDCMVGNENGEVRNHGEYSDTVGNDGNDSEESCKHAT